MVTTQSAVTVMAEILPGHEAALRQLLERAGAGSGQQRASCRSASCRTCTSRASSSSRPPTTSRAAAGARLVFLADVDGPADAFCAAVRPGQRRPRHASSPLCEGYPGAGAACSTICAAHHPVAAKYVNTIGRTVEQIQQEAALREAIQALSGPQRSAWRGADPRRVRAAIQEFVEARAVPGLGAPQRAAAGAAYILGEAHPLPCSSASPDRAVPGHPARPARLAVPAAAPREVRRRPRHHPRRRARPGPGRPGRPWRPEPVHVGRPAQAGPVPPLHRQRRAVGHRLSDPPRLQSRRSDRRQDHPLRATGSSSTRSGESIFTSNYDGSLENYMDDFIDKIAWGLNASFSHGVDYPQDQLAHPRRRPRRAGLQTLQSDAPAGRHRSGTPPIRA